jgi:deoxyadenosine/deoxycytidine kinase
MAGERRSVYPRRAGRTAPLLLALEGLPGAGKSTSARILSERHGIAFARETWSRHPFLHATSGVAHEFALEVQLAFLLLHYHEIHRLDRSSSRAIADFAPFRSLIFGRLNLSEANYALLKRVYTHFARRDAWRPIIVYLDVAPRVCLARIRDRCYPLDHDFELDYLALLRTAALEAVEQFASAGTIILDVADDEDEESVATRILQAARTVGY